MNAVWRWVTGVGLGLAVAGCGTPRVSTLDPRVRDDAEAARAAYAEGLIEKAVTLYERALARARLIDDRTEVGRNAYNLGLCELAAGRPERARARLREARVALGMTGPDAGRTYLAEAEAARAQGKRAEAGQLAASALARGADGDGAVQAALLLAETAAETNDLAAAATHYRRGLAKASTCTAPLLRARLEGVAVRLIRGGCLEGDAAAHLREQARFFKAAGRYGEMATALSEAGAAYSVSRRPEEACDCWFRAAQSQAAAGDMEAARATAARIEEASESAGCADCRERAAILMEALKR